MKRDVEVLISKKAMVDVKNKKQQEQSSDAEDDVEEGKGQYA